MRLAVDVAGEVLGGPADLEQHLLDAAALAGVHDDGVVVDAGAEHRGDLLVAQHLLEHRAVEADQDQAVHRALDQLQPAVAGHRVDDVDEQRLRHRVAGEGHQRVDHLLGVVPGGAGVPQRQRGDPVGVDVFGGAFQFGERRDGRPRLTRLLMVDLEQHGLVGLHDQRAVGHARSRHPLLACSVIAPPLSSPRPTPPTSRGGSRTPGPGRPPGRRRSVARRGR